MVFCSQSLAYSFSTQARQCKAVISKVLSVHKKASEFPGTVQVRFP